MSSVQWNLSNQDTNGAEEVSLLVRCPHFRGCKSGTWGGKRCPVWRGVLSSGVSYRERERFHCRHAMFCQFGHTDLHIPFTHTLITRPHTLTQTQCTSLPRHILWVRLMAEGDREKDTTRRPTKTRSQRIEKGSCVSEGDIERYIGTRGGV